MALLGNLTGSSQFFNPPTFYNDVATQSLRLNDDDDAHLKFDPSGAGNQKTWTCSAWVKRSKLGTNHNSGDDMYVFNTFTAGNNANCVVLGFRSDAPFFATYNLEVLKSNRLLRDTGAWYHIMWVLDTTQGTASNRLKIYINGTEETSFATDNRANAYLNQNEDLALNNGNEVRVGTSGASANPAAPLDGYIAEFNFVDGTALDPTYFGETKNGVWIPKKYTGSYGTNGVRLQFAQVGVSTASTSTIGADTSGNTNHFTSSGIVASDCALPDNPENNWCVGNAVGNVYADSVGNNPTYSEGNLEFETAGNPTHAYGTMAVNNFLTNGCYFEVRADALDTDRSYIGIVDPQSSANEASYGFVNKALFQSNVGRIFGTTDTDGTSVLPSTPTNYADGNIVGVAVKGTSVWFHVNGTYSRDGSNNLGNPSTGANPTLTNITNIATTHYLPYAGYNSDFTFNFGQDSSFAGAETAQGNTDANGNGDFYYAVPTGFLAMCSANMEEPTIGPNSATQSDDYFDITLYTGNSGNKTISGFNFQPDWVWGKSRSAAHNHHIHDSSRGVEQRLSLSTNDAEYGDGALKTFTSDGYTFDTAGAINTNNETYVNWVWHCNSGTTTTNDASSTGVGSIDSVIQANTTAGFSIVTYTGSSSGTDGTPSTIAHGLGAVPKWILFLPRDQYDGCVYHGSNTSAPATDRLILKASQSSDAAGATSDDSLFFNDTEPTSTVFSVGTRKHANSNGGMVAYCFADVEGYSKFGGFVGNGNADGAFVYTGFRPAWILIKNTARSADWRLHDIARQPTNDSGGHILLPNSNSAEVTNEYDMDFLSNGFKMRTSSVYAQGSGETVIYMAFAEAPFKYANAR